MLWSWPSFLKSLPRHYTINSLSIVTKLSYKTLMVYLYRLTYIKSYRLFVFQLSNSKKIVHYGKVSKFLQLPSTDRITWPMAVTEWDWLTLLLKDVKYIDAGACLGRINTWYWLCYMYFIVMGGESVPTSKIGRSDNVAFTWFLKKKVNLKRTCCWWHHNVLVRKYKHIVSHIHWFEDFRFVKNIH